MYSNFGVVLLRFSKSGKRTVSDRFVKKSADSDSVSDSRRIINLHTPAIEHSACPLVDGKCGDDAPRRRSFLAGKSQRNHGPTCRVPDTPCTHARTRTSDAPPATMQAAAHRRAAQCQNHMPPTVRFNTWRHALSPVIPIVISITTYSTVHVNSSFLI